MCCFIAVVVMVIVLCLLLAKTYRRLEDVPAHGKCVLISGCDSGIGQQVALHLMNLGMTVFAGCLHSDGEGANWLKQLENPNIHVIPLDITEQKSVEDALRYVTDHSPNGLWALINNAGVCVFGELDWMTWSQCVHQTNVNLLGTIRLTKACLRLLRKAKDAYYRWEDLGVHEGDNNRFQAYWLSSGCHTLHEHCKLLRRSRILMVSSVNGLVSYPGLAVYSATKRALEGLTDSLRIELSKFSIKVVSLEPGDFARLTNIMRDQNTHMDSMWDNMAEEERSLYRTYFPAYRQLVLKNAGLTSPPSFQHSSLLSDLKDAVLSPSPRCRYLSGPLALKIFVWIQTRLPDHLGDALVSWIFSTTFKGRDLQVQSS